MVLSAAGEMAALDPNALLTKNAFLGNDGLLHKLQSSEEFISLRGQEDSPRIKMPALFRTGAVRSLQLQTKKQ